MNSGRKIQLKRSDYELRDDSDPAGGVRACIKTRKAIVEAGIQRNKMQYAITFEMKYKLANCK